MAGTEIGLPQLMYMANMPPNECTSTVQQNDLAGLHNWLSELNLSGLIPIDYKNIVQQWK